MSIQRWDPLRDLIHIQERMNRLFEDVLSRSSESAGGEAVTYTGWKPAMDVFERADRYVLRADLPGVTSADVEVEVQDGTLILRGERRLDTSIPKESYLRTERPHGRFALQVALPPSVDSKSIQASHREGVLEVELPKRKQDVPSRIKVEVT